MHLLGISGSLRKEATNTKLIHEAARLFEASEFTAADIRFPLYDGDLEEAEGIPAAVKALTDQINSADAVVISTPEYNKAPSGALKNALDWISRSDMKSLQDKPMAIMSATAGRAGGERAQFALRLMLMPFAPKLLQSPEVLVAQSSKQFDDNGRLTDDAYIDFLGKLMGNLKALV
ncbi:NADPH-dependent FMN reductase [Pseudaestuariivita rosea]|uniref:NADPH-dependent FMN reductase n=1 Tax=Pseudaestuariivita rosea TaxID=2763263 RepID=UPI001ABA10D5|nr:NAD(P)H-dependent oxidoreductase [Pseudaestuariivita rosea]